MRPISDITGWHAHIYYGHPGWVKRGHLPKPHQDSRKKAKALRKTFKTWEESTFYKGNITVGIHQDEPVGPHTQPMFQLEISTSAFSEVFRFLVLNRKGLSVLFHPLTGNTLEEHTELAVWLGDKIPLRLDKL